MEKDYFLDRHPQNQDRSKINRGDKVFICLKSAQKYAKVLDDLTLITVTANLTSQSIHPRGQKVKGIENIITDNGKEEQIERVGRVVYKLEDDCRVLTKEGLKYIYEYYENDQKHIKLVSYENLKGLFSLFVLLRLDKFTFEFPIAPWIYFKEKDIQNYVNKLFISDFELHYDFITYMHNDTEKRAYNYSVYYNNQPEKEDNSEVFDFICNNYKSQKYTNYNYNKTFSLEYIGLKAYII